MTVEKAVVADWERVVGAPQDEDVRHLRQALTRNRIRALREIRVRAAPSWRASDVALLFLFVRGDSDETFAGQDWDNYLDLWLHRVQPEGRFRHVDGVVQTLDDLTGRDCVESDPLDLDHLSSRET